MEFLKDLKQLRVEIKKSVAKLNSGDFWRFVEIMNYIGYNLAAFPGICANLSIQCLEHIVNTLLRVQIEVDKKFAIEDITHQYILSALKWLDHVEKCEHAYPGYLLKILKNLDELITLIDDKKLKLIVKNIKIIIMEKIWTAVMKVGDYETEFMALVFSIKILKSVQPTKLKKEIIHISFNRSKIVPEIIDFLMDNSSLDYIKFCKLARFMLNTMNISAPLNPPVYSIRGRNLRLVNENYEFQIPPCADLFWIDCHRFSKTASIEVGLRNGEQIQQLQMTVKFSSFQIKMKKQGLVELLLKVDLPIKFATPNFESHPVLKNLINAKIISLNLCINDNVNVISRNLKSFLSLTKPAEYRQTEYLSTVFQPSINVLSMDEALEKYFNLEKRDTGKSDPRCHMYMDRLKRRFNNHVRGSSSLLSCESFGEETHKSDTNFCSGKIKKKKFTKSSGLFQSHAHALSTVLEYKKARKHFNSKPIINVEAILNIDNKYSLVLPIKKFFFKDINSCTDCNSTPQYFAKFT